ncbi:hypothetical protein ACKU27_13895 [Sphingobium yanoikuyae]|uniref:hypothetical protein n=1 Tax=Sphingobium yanoikuyae TaxID=13690 RepID=UPI0028AB883E|nr:hypothetical protein [Sphingobium yanoikuyae]
MAGGPARRASRFLRYTPILEESKAQLPRNFKASRIAGLRFEEATRFRLEGEAIIKSVGEKRDQIMASILIQPFPRIESMLMLPLANSQVYDFIAKSTA